MTIKEMCELANIEYDFKNPKRSLDKLNGIFIIEKVTPRKYNIIRKLTEDEQIQNRKLSKCKELLEKTILVQLSLEDKNTMRFDMKGYLENFCVVNKNYRHFSYENMNSIKYDLLKDFDEPQEENKLLHYFVEDINPILYRMMKETFKKLQSQMYIYVKEHLMFATKLSYKDENNNDTVEFTNKREATNDEIELYMKYYKQFATEMGYDDNTILNINGKHKNIIKSKICRKLNIGWCFYEYELVLNRYGIQQRIENDNELQQIKLSLNKNTIHKINTSKQGELKNYNEDKKKEMTDFLIKIDNPQ